METDRNSDHPDPSVGIELDLVYSIEPGGVSPAKGWEIDRTDDREARLAPVAVTRELKDDPMVWGRYIREIGLVGEEDCRGVVGHPAQRLGEVRKST